MNQFTLGKAAITAWLIVSSLPFSAAAQELPVYPGLTLPERQSIMKRHAENRDSGLRQLLYLVDLAGKADLEIIFDGAAYKTSQISPLARLFLMKSYKNQSAETWLKTWCVRSSKGNPIFIRFPDGNTAPAIAVLLNELTAYGSSDPR